MNDLLNPNGKFEIFNYQNLGRVRVQVDSQGNPWFCLADVCQVLGIADNRVLSRRLNPKGECLTPTPTNGGIQNMIFIDEGNLYITIGRSRKPEAQPFMEWIYREVIPMIRRTGMYMNDDVFNTLVQNPGRLGEALINYQKEIDRLRQDNKSYDSFSQELQYDYNNLVQDYSDLLDENEELQERIRELEDELDY